MKPIAVVLLLACSLVVAGCSRKPTAPAPVVEATSAPSELTEEQTKKQAAGDEAAQAKKMAEADQATAAQPVVANPDAVIKAPAPNSPASSPKP
jgi:PBP1b-binding outer membrane lipoprotein LpoB